MKISSICLIGIILGSIPVNSFAQVEGRQRTMGPRSQQLAPPPKVAEVSNGTDIELARLNEGFDRYLIIFSEAAAIPKGQKDKSKAKLRALRLSSNLLKSARVSSETLKSLEVTTGVVNAAYVSGLTPDQISKIRRDRRVLDIEKDAYFPVIRDGIDSNPASWGLDRIDQRNLPLDGQHEYSDKTTANIYVMDGGIDFSHPEFAGRTGDQIDFTGDTQTSCDNHGTHIAGTIAGSTYGIARAATIHDLKSSHCTNAYSSKWWFINPINHVANNSPGLSIINYSASIPNGSFPTSMINAVVDAVTQHNIVFVTSAGNITSQSPSPNACTFFPNSLPEVLTVAYSTQTNAFGAQSKYGPCVDLAAPGENIISAKRFGANGPMTGTSMAAPHIAGIAASIWMDQPSLTSQQVMQKVVDEATPGMLSGVPAGVPNLLSYYKAPLAGTNQAPLAIASINWPYVYSGRPGVEISSAASSDPDNNTPLTFSWTEINHGFMPPNMTPNMPNDTVVFTAPSVSAPTTYYFDLKTKDSLGLQSVGSSGVSMVVVPDVCTPYDQNKLLGELSVTIAGSPNSNFTIKGDVPKLEATIRDYVVMAQSQNPMVSGGAHWMGVKDMGNGAAPVAVPVSIPDVDPHSASVLNGVFALGTSSGTATSFWENKPLKVGNWYRLRSTVRPVHNSGGMFDTCNSKVVDFRLPSVSTTAPQYLKNRPIEFYDQKSGVITTSSVKVYAEQMTGTAILGGAMTNLGSQILPVEHSSCFKAQNGKYVVSESDALSVNANRATCGPWEAHTIIDVNGGVLADGDRVNVKTHMGKYWSAQPSGALEANRSQIGAWEEFQIFSVGGGNIVAGSIVRLKGAHGKWIAAVNGGGGPVAANSQYPGTSELFFYEDP